MTTKGKNVSDSTRFEGNGISYRAKLIGIEDVPEARGDQMCQDALTKLKNAVKISGEHKRKIFVNVTLEGLKIIDAISLGSNQSKKKNDPKSPKSGEENEQLEKGQDLIVLHTHAVHRISFISRDTTDNRAFGYIFGQEDGGHKFFAIKTAAAAEQLVLALRDLFQVVYEMKKQEMDEAKEKLEKGEINTGEENSQTSGTGSTSGTGQTPTEKASADAENIYQVPTNNAPVNPEAQAEQVANLLELEDQADHILKDIEHIKNLEFDTVSSESAPTTAVSPPTSPMAQLAPPSSAAAAAPADPWGLSELSSPATPASTPATSALGDLAGLSSASFPSMGQQPFGQQAFAGTPFSMQSGFGGTGLGINMLTGGLPVTKDPFANDPFGAPAQQQQQQTRMPGAGGFGVANPFGAGYGQPYGMQGGQPSVRMQGGMMPGVMPGMVPHGMMSPPGYNNPFGGPAAQPQMANPFGGDDDNVLKPMKKDTDQNTASEDSSKAAAKSPRPDLFGDLVDIKKSAAPSAKSPKDMFKQINAAEKKSMNAMKSEAVKPPAAGLTSQASPAAAQASDSESDPFGERISIGADRTRGLLPSEDGEKDPFDVSYIPPSLAEPSDHYTHLVSSVSSPVTNPPPVPARHPSFPKAEDISLSSPSMPPSIPPPPAPSLPTISATPPLPSRTPSTPKILKDVNANTFTPPSDLSISQTSPADSSFMLPSPDEPPPPLPSHLTLTSPSAVAPPPPPRPIVKSTTLPSSPVHPPKRQGDENDKSSNNVSPTCQSDSLSPIRLAEPGAKEDHSTEFRLESPAQVQASPDICDAKMKAGDVFPDMNFPLASHFHEPDVNTQVNSTGSVNDSISSQSKQSWVSFDQADKDPFVFQRSVDVEESDPFNMPVHLTPGFKAVAKYGSDPFDDSINSMLSSSTEPWDPFGDQTNVVGSPFGDVFGAPPQPQSVNGNQATDKPLLD